jgi:AI-2 transport protein TqsA
VLLSVPLTIVLKIMFESFEETKWMARLMDSSGNGEEGVKGKMQEEGN